MKAQPRLRRFLAGGGIAAALLALMAGATFYRFPNGFTGLCFALTLCFVGLAAEGPNDGPG